IGRDALYDWSNDRPMELHIDCIDRKPGETVAIDLADMDRRIRAVGRLTEFSVDFFLAMNDRIAAAGLNRFHAQEMGHSDSGGGNPRALSMHMIYDIGPDDALIIESDMPQNARYWSLALHDPWWQTSDYADHHSCLNGHQAVVDGDGKVR